MEYINFRKTGGKNIIQADSIRYDEEIYLDKLEKQIIAIQEQIDSIPTPIKIPKDLDPRIIELIEEYNVNIPIADTLLTEKQKWQSLLDQCNECDV